MKVKIPIFFKSEGFDTNELIGKETPYEECDVREMIFYNINNISPFFSDLDGRFYCLIHANSSEFVSPLSIKEVEKLIDDAN